MPGFFIYPTKNYKTTTLKAPMAHKTFSQEQFMIRYYFLSITFYTHFTKELGFAHNSNSSNSLNNSLFYSVYIIKSIQPISTNLLLLKRYSLSFYSLGGNYFSYHTFNKVY